jgi:hypothetical protein
MNIPPILERLLLSNEAVFKNASLGLTGENMVFVPPGKTAVLLEFSIEPFVNDISSTFLNLLDAGVYPASTYTTQFLSLIKRCCYELQIINDNYSTNFNFHDNFSIQGNHQNTPTDYTGTINLQFSGKREELFIYTDRSMYFNFLYPFKTQEIGRDTTGIVPYYGSPSAEFSPTIQTLPKHPITFNGNGFIDFMSYAQINSPSLDSYYPVNWQVPGGIGLAQMEYLRFFAGANESSIQQPLPSGTDLDFQYLFTLPLLNVKYALINKRASDYGITSNKA